MAEVRDLPVGSLLTSARQPYRCFGKLILTMITPCSDHYWYSHCTNKETSKHFLHDNVLFLRPDPLRGHVLHLPAVTSLASLKLSHFLSSFTILTRRKSTARLPCRLALLSGLSVCAHDYSGHALLERDPRSDAVTSVCRIRRQPSAGSLRSP